MRRRAALIALGAWSTGAAVAPAWAQGASGRLTLPDARLLDQAGGTHRLRGLCDGPVVIGFFYTGCSTVCPPQTAALRALREQLDRGHPPQRAAAFDHGRSAGRFARSPAQLCAALRVAPREPPA